VLEARRQHRGQQAVGCAVGLREQERHQRQLRDVELQVSHDPLEGRVGDLDVGELER
jgi:hypothetical protein